MAMNTPEQRCLLVDDGLGIGIFKSLEEIYNYVKKGYPAAKSRILGAILGYIGVGL